jgi:hypothetical protein
MAFNPISGPGCSVAASGYKGTPQTCRAEPEFAGLVFFEYPKVGLWVTFACREHVGELVAPRRLTEADRAEQERRRTIPNYAPGPLAVGTKARQRLEYARRWEIAHPLDVDGAV